MKLKDLLAEQLKDGMTTEEIMALLEGTEAPKVDTTGYIKKDMYDKVASEVADWKKKYKAKLTEEEQKIQAAEEERKRFEQEYSELKKTVEIANHSKKFLGLGYDEKLATETAEALVTGDMEKVFVNQSLFLENQKKQIKADLLKGTPAPPTGTGGTVETDYAKKASEAQSQGDYAAAAYYTRLAGLDQKAQQ